MELFIVSTHRVLDHNSGFINLITSDYDEAFGRAALGDFIFTVKATGLRQIFDGGKMAVKINVD